MHEIEVRAPANIALVKYWGKRDQTLNLPAVGSLSITLADLTSTTVATEAAEDSFVLEGDDSAAARERALSMLEKIRALAGRNENVRIHSQNNFPTGAGLASSASGFAALVLALDAFFDLRMSKRELSILARQGSGSAARSLFGGYVRMHRGDQPDGSDCYAEQLHQADALPLDVLVAVTSEQKKRIGSTRGMISSADTALFWKPWVDGAEADLRECEQAIANRDFERLAAISEHSCLKMHALAMSGLPPLVYWNGATVEAMHAVRTLRNEGTAVFFTIDAGPQLKAVCEPSAAAEVQRALEDVPGVKRIIHTKVGAGPTVTRR